MSLPSARQFKLASPRGDGRHPYVNADGAFIGRGVPLLERDPLGRWRPRDGATLARLLAIGYGATFELEWRAAQLRGVTAALNEGDLVLAGISLVQMQLPALPCAGNARAMAIADGLLGKYNPDWGDEPRVPAGNPDGGQWTDGDGGDSQDASVTPAAARTDATQAKKERFVDAHLADAQMGAARLRVPVENILGLSALESSWGEHHFAAEGNNFFLAYTIPLRMRPDTDVRGAARSEWPLSRVTPTACGHSRQARVHLFVVLPTPVNSQRRCKTAANSESILRERRYPLRRRRGPHDPQNPGAPVATADMIGHRAFRYILAIAGIAAGLTGNAAVARSNPPSKIDEQMALRLAAEGYDHGVKQKWFDYDPGMSPPFFVFYGVTETDGSFGYFAVNPWTGESGPCGAVISCRLQLCADPGRRFGDVSPAWN